MKKPKPTRHTRIRVVIADDHPVVREGLVTLIRAQPDMKLVAEAASGQEAIHQYFVHRPQVILMDLSMPDLNGIEATRTILEKVPGANILILSAYRTPEDIYQVLRAGAKAYLLKSCSRNELLTSIRSVCDGQVAISAQLATDLAAGITRERLTKREAEVIRLVVDGRSNKEIGTLLGITEGTVKIHLTHIFKKLAAKGRTDAIRLALAQGIVQMVSSVRGGDFNMHLFPIGGGLPEWQG